MVHDIFANAQLTPEQQQVLNSLATTLTETQALVKKLETKIAKLEEQATQEPTIMTRPEFNREVARMLAFDERYGGISSVLYFDIASLKGLAAAEGNDVASKAVRSIGAILSRHVRSSDIVGRLAPDEFGVLLVRCNNENAWKKGRELAALLVIALDEPEGKKLGLKISFGAYTFREEEDVATGLKEAAQAITHADKA